MNDILKQRLVGALILVALGVVFWPIIFVQPEDRALGEAPDIPAAPAVDTSAIETPDLAGLRPSPDLSVDPEGDASWTEVDMPEPESDPEPEETVADTTTSEQPQTAPVQAPKSAAPAPVVSGTTRSEPPVKPKLDKDGIPIAWILQVASVSSSEKADQLRKRLLEMDQKAYVKRVNRGGKTLFRVYIGPKYEQARLESVKSEVDSVFGVQSMIVRYYP